MTESEQLDQLFDQIHQVQIELMNRSTNSLHREVGTSTLMGDAFEYLGEAMGKIATASRIIAQSEKDNITVR